MDSIFCMISYYIHLHNSIGSGLSVEEQNSFLQDELGRHKRDLDTKQSEIDTLKARLAKYEEELASKELQFNKTENSKRSKQINQLKNYARSVERSLQHDSPQQQELQEELIRVLKALQEDMEKELRIKEEEVLLYSNKLKVVEQEKKDGVMYLDLLTNNLKDTITELHLDPKVVKKEFCVDITLDLLTVV